MHHRLRNRVLPALCLALALPLSAAAQQGGSINNAIRHFNDGRYAEAAFGFYDVAAYDSVIENRLRAEFYLARSLQRMDLQRSSAFFYAGIMNQGPNHPYYLRSIQELVELIEAMGDDVFLPVMINREYNQAFQNLPAEALYKINYLIGLIAYRQERPADAISFLQAVPRESAYYAKARYLTGIINTFLRGRDGAVSALQDYEAVVALQNTRDLEYWELHNTKELAILALARTHYTLGNYEESVQWYEKIDRYTTYWDTKLFEMGWSAFMAGDVGLALGTLHTLRAPQFVGMFQPESVILKATVYFTACLYEEVGRELQAFDSRYVAMAQTVSEVLEKHQATEDFPLYLAMLVDPDTAETRLPLAVRNRLLSNHRIRSLLDYLHLIDQEIERARNVTVWRDSAMQREILQDLAAQREQNVLATGQFIRARLRALARDVETFRGQAQILRFETSKAEMEMLEAGVDPETRLRGQQLLRPALPGSHWEYWSFNGEWWVDELGYYRYTLKSACDTPAGAAGP
jgi:tetratricopeptide (TPR) repeat protein